MKQLFFSLFIVGAFVFGSAVQSIAQTVNFDACAAGDPCTATWTTSTARFTLAKGCIIEVTYEFRNCPPVAQFRILSYSVIRDGFNNSTCDFLGAQTVLQLIEFNLIQNAFVNPSVPNCPPPGAPPTQGALIAQFFVASCVYESTCTFTFANDPDVVCDPPSAEQPGDKSIRSWTRTTHLPCGTTCCKRTYEVCNSINPEDGQIYRNIKRLPNSNSGCDPSAKPPGADPLKSCIPLCN